MCRRKGNQEGTQNLVRKSLLNRVPAKTGRGVQRDC
jgi:hypothetical protein